MQNQKIVGAFEIVRKQLASPSNDEPKSCKRPKNDVFINYSFEDIGRSFISHLKGALKLHSFTITDHTMLSAGQNVHSELLKAIEESEIYVLVFSPNYASSRRCLDELVLVINCFHKFEERKVLPVFFKVEPSHVRNQQGSFMEAFQAHKTNVNPKSIQEWRETLKEAGYLSGLIASQYRDDAKFVRKIVKVLEKMQRPHELHVTDLLPVGIGSEAEDLISKLRLDQDHVLVVAVFGISGIYKTAIVKETFNRIAPTFDRSCYLADIHNICQVPNWKGELPRELIACPTRGRMPLMSNHNDYATKIIRLVRGQKVLMVLDGISSFQQLKLLGIYPELFYKGSIIIVNTEDKRALGNIPYVPYYTRLLNKSLSLFPPLMFESDGPMNTKFIDVEPEKIQRPRELHVTDHPVGVGSRAEDLISTLRLDLKDCALVVAVYGMSGIGKTTIVKEVFNRIAPSFDLSCFLPDICSICRLPNWKVELTKAFISCLTCENKFSTMSDHNEGVTKIRELLSRQKVLLVLDDIDNYHQLESSGIYPEWFYKGSRIIVTTRDKGALGNIPHASYHTKLLNRRESLNLFTRLMFTDKPANTKVIEQVVSRAGGLPLVLMVWSRHFQQYEKELWPSILECLNEIPHGDVQKQLEMSYDSLTNRSKKFFLDIACFFHDREDKDIIIKVLEDEDLRLFPNYEIQYLIDKNLVGITPYNQLWMHHAIREMGQEIVRQQHEDEPGQRTRLFNTKDAMRVLTECSGTEEVESIRVESDHDMQEGVTVEAFRKMTNLRLISLRGVDCKSKFPNEELTPLYFKRLKYMSWFKFPFKCFDVIDMHNIVVLRVRNSKLETLWEGIKILKKLEILDVSGSCSLTKTGDISGLENLEELYFGDCKNLKELHDSIGYLENLVILDLRPSMPLKRIPWEMICKIKSLRELFLGGDRLESEPDEVYDSWLNYLQLECTIVTLKLYQFNFFKISIGFVSLPWLKHLYLVQTNFPSNPDHSLIHLHQLSTIELEDCDLIQSIPNLPRNITSIKAHHCSSLVNLPCNISELKSLTVLDFSSCPKLGTEDPHFLIKVTGLTNLSLLRMNDCSVSHIPSEIENLASLKELNLSKNPFCSLPDSLSNLSQLLYLNIDDCHQLKLLPLLPSSLIRMYAKSCHSLDVMSPASIRTKVCKESPFSIGFMLQLSWEKKVPEWCSYQSSGDVLSFVAPVNLNSICGIIVCANTSSYYDEDIIIPKMYNETKNTSHYFEAYTGQPSTQDMLKNCMCVMSYPLDNTKLLVEPGDSVVLKLPHGSISSCGLQLIYESNVVDCNIGIEGTGRKPPATTSSSFFDGEGQTTPPLTQGQIASLFQDPTFKDELQKFMSQTRHQM